MREADMSGTTANLEGQLLSKRTMELHPMLPSMHNESNELPDLLVFQKIYCFLGERH